VMAGQATVWKGPRISGAKMRFRGLETLAAPWRHC
jgi:hypothetical protein